MNTRQTIDGVPRERIQEIISDIERGARLTALERLHALLHRPAECRCKRFGKDNPHWPCPVHTAPAQPQGEPVKVPFNTLSYGAKYKYEAEHGPDKVYVKIGHDLVAAWDERLVSSSWRAQGICSFAGGDSALSDEVYLVRDSDFRVSQPQGESVPIESREVQSGAAATAAQMLFGGDSISWTDETGLHTRDFVDVPKAHPAPVAAAPDSRCPSCLCRPLFGCDDCIPDFGGGGGNRARRRAQAIEQGCPQPQAHPARCGCKDGNE